FRGQQTKNSLGQCGQTLRFSLAGERAIEIELVVCGRERCVAGKGKANLRTLSAARILAQRTNLLSPLAEVARPSTGGLNKICQCKTPNLGPPTHFMDRTVYLA